MRAIARAQACGAARRDEVALAALLDDLRAGRRRPSRRPARPAPSPRSARARTAPPTRAAAARPARAISCGTSSRSPSHDTRSCRPARATSSRRPRDVVLVVKARRARDELRRADQQQMRVDALADAAAQRFDRRVLALPRAQLRDDAEQQAAARRRLAEPPRAPPRGRSPAGSKRARSTGLCTTSHARARRGGPHRRGRVARSWRRSLVAVAAIRRSVAVLTRPGGRQSRTCTIVGVRAQAREARARCPARIELACTTSARWRAAARRTCQAGDAPSPRSARGVCSGCSAQAAGRAGDRRRRDAALLGELAQATRAASPAAAATVVGQRAQQVQQRALGAADDRRVADVEDPHARDAPGLAVARQRHRRPASSWASSSASTRSTTRGHAKLRRAPARRRRAVAPARRRAAAA